MMDMKSHKYAIMKRARIQGVYANVFIKHVELRDTDVGIEYTSNPAEAMIVYGRDAAVRYAMAITSLTKCGRFTFAVDKIGRLCRPNAYLIYSLKDDSGVVFRFRDRAESALSHLKPFNPVIYPLYGYKGDYDY